jgi:FixJ family two-component response regulator
VLDIAMPGMSGLDLQRELVRQRRSIPVVFITAHGDEALRPPAAAAGAVACLLKPFTERALVTALHLALKAG